MTPIQMIAELVSLVHAGHGYKEIYYRESNGKCWKSSGFSLTGELDSEVKIKLPDGVNPDYILILD